MDKIRGGGTFLLWLPLPGYYGNDEITLLKAQQAKTTIFQTPLQGFLKIEEGREMLELETSAFQASAFGVTNVFADCNPSPEPALQTEPAPQTNCLESQTAALGFSCKGHQIRSDQITFVHTHDISI